MSEPRMIQRMTVVSSDVGEPLDEISAKPPPITSAATAKTRKARETLRGVLQKKRDWERSGRAPLRCGSFTVPSAGGRQCLPTRTHAQAPTARALEWATPRRERHGSARSRTRWGLG